MMRLINFNYSQQTVTNVSASSSNVNYPVSNIKHEFRSKQWRSKGNFVINSTNNKIDFKESAMGSELTATISSGSYSNSSLATEIKSKLEAVGANTYTVSFSDASGLWSIESDGSFLSLLNASGTNQANSILKNSLGFANSDRTGSLEYTGSNIAIHTSEWMVFDLVTTESINSIALLWPKEDGILLTENAVVRIQANATNEWSSPAVDQLLSLSENYEIYSHYFELDQDYRFWRVVITDPTNPNLFVNCGVVILGKSIEVENPDNGFSWLLTDLSKSIKTEFGHEYVDQYPTLASLDIDFNVLDYSDALSIENAFRQNGIRKPVFVTLDYNNQVFNKDHFCIYGKFKSELPLGHISFDLFKSGLSIRETS